MSPRGAASCKPEAADIAELNPGDVVFAPDGEEHWTALTLIIFMTHLCITEVHRIGDFT